MLFNLLLPLSLSVGVVRASFGAHWALNPHDRKAARILHATTTVEVPQNPSPQVDTLFLWPGMDTVFGGLVQSLLISSAPGDGHPWSCDAEAGQWCTETSLRYGYLGYDGLGFAVDAGDLLTFDYQYDLPSKRYTQTISRGDEVLTTFKSYSGGWAYNWYIQTECHYLARGATPASTWSNTTIQLEFAQPEFAATLHTNHSTNTPIVSRDGGKTWTIETINLEAYSCYPEFDDTSASGGGSGILNVTSSASGTLASTVAPTSTLTGSAAMATSAATSGVPSDITFTGTGAAATSSASMQSSTTSSTISSTTSSSVPLASSEAGASVPLAGAAWLMVAGVLAVAGY